MVFKINISDKGKTLKLETESEELVGKKIGEAIKGEEISKELSGYVLEITGTSDIAGFPGKKDVEGSALKRVLLTKGFSMHKRPRREGKKQVYTPNGLRLKKSVRGNTISKDTIQINTKVTKEGSKKFETLLPKKEEKIESKEEKKEETKAEMPAEILAQ